MIKSGYNMATIPDKRPGMFNGDLSVGIILFSVPRTFFSRSADL